ncbi:MAG: Clp protease family protein [Clostridiaceae bacterium]|jgi:ATP-dependent protease ClpP protease subunit|nr:Clp protease family protein [Clostridiaceae bacterium]
MVKISNKEMIQPILNKFEGGELMAKGMKLNLQLFGEKPKTIWELKQAVTPGTLEMYIYGNVQGDYYDWWKNEEVESETSANHFRNELAKYPDVTQIDIYINSYGGSVFEGTAIYSQLKRHPAKKIVHDDGFICSVAATIAMCADWLIMPRNTMMFIHNATNYAYGNSKQLRKAADDLDVIMQGNIQAYLEKSNGKITEEKLIELMEAETWLTAQQCYEYGFCDEVLGQEVDLTEAKQLLQQMNKTLEQQLNYNKALSAQFKELVVAPVQKTPEPKAPPNDPEPPKESKFNRFLNQIKKKEEK